MFTGKTTFFYRIINMLRSFFVSLQVNARHDRLYRIIHTAILLLFAILAYLPAQGQARTTRAEYIEQYRQLAVDSQKKYGIPASITMAQGILESDCGNSRLAVKGNNHFGIKCKKDWKGDRIHHDDDAPQECFRKYPSAADSYRDHSEFLTGSQRYAGLFELDVTDYEGWARGLKAAGYATNPKYAELLIKIIEEERLYALGIDDKPKHREPKEPVTMDDLAGNEAPQADVNNYAPAGTALSGYTVYTNNGSDFVVAAAGDTYDSIAKATGVSRGKLRKFNEVPADAEPYAGQLVYLHKKATKAENGHLVHIVKEGETLWTISQAYGIRVKNLAKLNRTGIADALRPGVQLRLR